MRKGDQVVCRRQEPPKGSWRVFDGRHGEVVESGNLGEIGVRFDPDGPVLWFLRQELEYDDGAGRR